MSKKDKLISVEHLKWNVGGIECGTLSVNYLNWILDHEEPAVDAEPVRHGRWRPVQIGKWYGFECTACKVNREVPCSNKSIPQWKYCPECGARMDEDE